MNTLIENLQKLCKQLEEMKFPEAPALHIESLHERFKDILTPEAAATLEPLKATTLHAFDAERGPAGYSRAIYLSAIIHSPEGIEKAGRLLYSEVNKLAALGVLCGHLTKLSILTLADGRFRDLHEYLPVEGAPRPMPSSSSRTSSWIGIPRGRSSRRKRAPSDSTSNQS